MSPPLNPRGSLGWSSLQFHPCAPPISLFIVFFLRAHRSSQHVPNAVLHCFHLFILLFLQADAVGTLCPMARWSARSSLRIRHSRLVAMRRCLVSSVVSGVDRISCMLFNGSPAEVVVVHSFGLFYRHMHCRALIIRSFRTVVIGSGSIRDVCFHLNASRWRAESLAVGSFVVQVVGRKERCAQSFPCVSVHRLFVHGFLWSACGCAISYG